MSSIAATSAPTMSRSRSSIAASATPTCTRPATTGAGRSIPSFPATRSSAGCRGRQRRHPLQGGRHGGRRLHGRQLRQCDQCLQQRGADVPQGRDRTYNGQDRITGESPMAAIPSISSCARSSCWRAGRARLARAAPLLCAGITTYSPLRTWNVGPGSRVGVIGLGGLGHMAVKLAVGLGADVTVISRTDAKAADALALGADACSSRPMRRRWRRRPTLRPHHRHHPGAARPVALSAAARYRRARWSLSASSAWSTSTALCRCSWAAAAYRARRSAASPRRRRCSISARRKNILPECEMIAIQDINAAFERMERADVRYRFVIDMASLGKRREGAAFTRVAHSTADQPPVGKPAETVLLRNKTTAACVVEYSMQLGRRRILPPANLVNITDYCTQCFSRVPT